MKSHMFDRCDEDDDGFIDLYEFKHCYCHDPDDHDHMDEESDEHDHGGGDDGGDNNGGGDIPHGCEGTA